MKKKFTASLVILLILALISGFAVIGCGGEKEEAKVTETKTEKTTDAVKTAGQKSVLVILCETDFAEFEYAPVRSALEYAGFTVEIANASGGDSVGYDGSKVTPDLKIDQAKADDYQAVVIIGGDGVKAYYDNPQIHALVNDANAKGKVVAAICIAPVVLVNAGVLNGKKGTVSPSYEQTLSEKGCLVQDAPVVVDGNAVTGDGPEAAQEFADTLVNTLKKQ